MREPGLGLGRDPVRTPMPWDESPQAGFTTGEPWLPLAAGWREENVAIQMDRPASMLALHRALLALRRATPARGTGSIPLFAPEGAVLAYEREADGERYVVAPAIAPTHLRSDEGLILKVDTTA